MAYSFHVSLQITEKDLFNWIRKQMKNNDISPSIVFRDAMMQKKRDWDILQAENPAILKEQNERLKKTIGMQSQFIQKDPERQQKWFDFFEGYEDNKKTEPEIVKILEDKSQNKKSKRKKK